MNHNSSRVFSNGTSDKDAGFTLLTSLKNSVTHINRYTTFSQFHYVTEKELLHLRTEIRS
jgi:hypothetical protein